MDSLSDTLEALLQEGGFLENLSSSDQLLYAAALAATIVVLMLLEEEEAAEEIIQPRVKRTRTARRIFDCQGAYQCIRRDHLGDRPLFGKDFQMYFTSSAEAYHFVHIATIFW
jgi:hypothetical protein